MGKKSKRPSLRVVFLFTGSQGCIYRAAETDGVANGEVVSVCLSEGGRCRGRNGRGSDSDSFRSICSV